MLSGPEFAVTMTSTRVPGTVNPATPTMSFTRTAMARMPGGIVGGNPAPDARGASLDSVTGSFSLSDSIAPRPTISSGLENPPGTCESVGQGTTFNWSAVSIVPTGTAWLATTVNVFATGTSRTGRLSRARYTPKLATLARATARATTMSVRLRRFMVNPLSPLMSETRPRPAGSPRRASPFGDRAAVPRGCIGQIAGPQVGLHMLSHIGRRVLGT